MTDPFDSVFVNTNHSKKASQTPFPNSTNDHISTNSNQIRSLDDVQLFKTLDPSYFSNNEFWGMQSNSNPKSIPNPKNFSTNKLPSNDFTNFNFLLEPSQNAPLTSRSQ